MTNSNEQSQGQTKKCPKCQETIQLGAKKCKHCGADLRNWFVKHKIITGILILFFIGIIGSAMGGGENNKQNNNSTAPVNESSPKVEEKAEAPEETKPTTSADTDQSPIPTKIEDKPAPTSSETVSQKNAVAKAKSYLGYSAFSHDGLVAQLEYEQFSHADAVYGADNSGADWNEQAAKKAKSYMEYSAFSRGSLIEQLKYDKFTQAQAEYGANAVGL